MFRRKYEIVKGKYGPRMSLFAEWSDSIAKLIKARKIVELELNYAKGWKCSADLSFLKTVSHILVFELLDHQISNISDIHVLSELRELDVNTTCTSEIDFSCFPHLEGISLEWRPKAKSLFDCTTLKRVFVNCGNFESLQVFHKLHKLESLSLKNPKIESIGDISLLQNLEFLGIYNARRLTSLRGIEVLNNLKQLDVERCRKIKDIEPVSALTQLEKLWFPNNGEIASLIPITNLKELRACYFHESTNILDGNIAIIKGLMKLEDTSFQERRHYNCTRNDLPPMCKNS